MMEGTRLQLRKSKARSAVGTYIVTVGGSSENPLKGAIYESLAEAVDHSPDSPPLPVRTSPIQPPLLNLILFIQRIKPRDKSQSVCLNVRPRQSYANGSPKIYKYIIFHFLMRVLSLMI